MNATFNAYLSADIVLTSCFWAPVDNRAKKNMIGPCCVLMKRRPRAEWKLCHTWGRFQQLVLLFSSHLTLLSTSSDLLLSNVIVQIYHCVLLFLRGWKWFIACSDTLQLQPIKQRNVRHSPNGKHSIKHRAVRATHAAGWSFGAAEPNVTHQLAFLSPGIQLCSDRNKRGFLTACPLLPEWRSWSWRRRSLGVILRPHSTPSRDGRFLAEVALHVWWQFLHWFVSTDGSGRETGLAVAMDTTGDPMGRGTRQFLPFFVSSGFG